MGKSPHGVRIAGKEHGPALFQDPHGFYVLRYREPAILYDKLVGVFSDEKRAREVWQLWDDDRRARCTRAR